MPLKQKSEVYLVELKEASGLDDQITEINDPLNPEVNSAIRERASTELEAAAFLPPAIRLISFLVSFRASFSFSNFVN